MFYLCTMETLYNEIFSEKNITKINSKRKGNKNENSLAKFLTIWTNYEFTRIPQSGGLRWINTQNICGDLISTEPNFYFPFTIETKHLKTYSDLSNKKSKIFSIWKQILRDSDRDKKYPALFLRKNYMPQNLWDCIFSKDNFNLNKLENYISCDSENLFCIKSNNLPNYKEFITFINIKKND